MPEETEETTEELISEETPDYSGDIEEVREFAKDHTHKGIDTSRIRSEDIVRKLDSGARAYNTGGQTLTTSTATKVELNTETFDIAGEFDSTTNYRFTVNKEGYYFIHACLQVQPTSGDDKWYAYIYKNGAKFSEAINLSGGVEQFSTQITDILKLNKGDYVEIFIEQTSGGNQTMFAGEALTFAIIYKIY